MNEEKVSEFVLGTLVDSSKKQFAVVTIVELADHRFGSVSIRNALNSLVNDKKIICRRYRHNLHRYSIE